MLEMLRARVESATFAEHEQRVRPLYPAGSSGEARLDYSKGLPQESQSVLREPMRSSRRFVRKWTFRGGLGGSKVEKVSP